MVYAVSAAAASPITTPVSVRGPTGTITRAPAAGIGRSSGTEYVRRPSVGTGTATDTRRADDTVSSLGSAVES